MAFILKFAQSAIVMCRLAIILILFCHFACYFVVSKTMVLDYFSFIRGTFNNVLL